MYGRYSKWSCYIFKVNKNMSLNTYILIKESMKNHYEVSLRDADDGNLIDDYGIEHTLEAAVKLANQYEEESEYGIHFRLKGE